MKKQVTIVGISHRKGTSRSSGKEFDFYQMHCTFKDEFTEGLATCSLVVPDNEIAQLPIGKEVTLISHYIGNREYFDAVV